MIQNIAMRVLLGITPLLLANNSLAQSYPPPVQIEIPGINRSEYKPVAKSSTNLRLSSKPRQVIQPRPVQASKIGVVSAPRSAKPSVNVKDKYVDDTPQVRAAKLNNIAARQVRSGQYGPALKNLNEAISIHRDGLQYYFNRAQALMGLQRYNEAERDFRIVVKNNPRNAQAFQGLADALFFQKQYDEAVKYYKRTIDKNPSSHESYAQIGTIYGIGGYNDYATAYLSRSINMQPNYTAYLNRGLAYGRTGKTRQAYSDFRKALELDPNGATAYEGVCSTLGFMGNYEGAIGACDRAIELTPNSSSAYVNRAIVLDNMLREYDALEDLKVAVKLNPNSQTAQTMLADLKTLLED